MLTTVIGSRGFARIARLALRSSFASLGAVLALVACGGGASPAPSSGTGGGSSTASGGTTAGSGAATGGLSGASGSSSGGGTSGGGAGRSQAGGAGAAGTGMAGTGAAGASAGASGSGTTGAGAGGESGASGGSGAGFGGVLLGGAGGARGGAGGARGGAGGARGGVGGGGAGGSAGAPAYQPCPETGPCKIMPFGDSITEGYPITGGYRSELFRLARNGGHAITFVGSASNNSPATVDGVAFPPNHEGHGGYTIEGGNGIAQFVNTSIPNYRPDIITLMIGTNDINGNINVADAPNRLGRLLDSIFAADADVLVVLAQIVPTRTDGTNQAVRTYNAALPGLVSARTNMGRHLVLIDMYTAFTRDASYKTTLLGDNLHPNQAGYVRMAETWYQALVGYLR